jgi:hypothetical protein
MLDTRELPKNIFQFSKWRYVKTMLDNVHTLEIVGWMSDEKISKILNDRFTETEKEYHRRHADTMFGAILTIDMKQIYWDLKQNRYVAVWK